jgi:hypothetical protein
VVVDVTATCDGRGHLENAFMSELAVQVPGKIDPSIVHPDEQGGLPIRRVSSSATRADGQNRGCEVALPWAPPKRAVGLPAGSGE